jgi:hypothetical protein
MLTLTLRTFTDYWAAAGSQPLLAPGKCDSRSTPGRRQAPNNRWTGDRLAGQRGPKSEDSMKQLRAVALRHAAGMWRDNLDGNPYCLLCDVPRGENHSSLECSRSFQQHAARKFSSSIHWAVDRLRAKPSNPPRKADGSRMSLSVCFAPSKHQLAGARPALDFDSALYDPDQAVSVASRIFRLH